MGIVHDRIFPHAYREVEADPEARLDAYVTGSARAVTLVLAGSLFSIHLPMVLALSADLTGAAVVASFGAAALAVFYGSFRWGGRLGGERLAALAAALSVGSIMASASLENAGAVESYMLLSFVPLTVVAVGAYVPMCPKRGAILALITTAIYIVTWRAGAFAGSDGYHYLTLSFLTNAWFGALLLGHIRRTNFRRLFTRERELLAAHHETKAALDQLTATKDRLIEAEMMATLGRLSAGVAHEMSNPLAACCAALDDLAHTRAQIDGPAERARLSATQWQLIADELKEAIELGQLAADRASQVVASLRRQATVMAHTRVVDFRSSAEIASVIALLRHRTRSAGIAIEVREPLEAIVLRGDPARFAQVLTNLLRNAIDACVDAGCRSPIVVEVRRVPNGVEIAVVDQGPGIEPARRSKIFEPMHTTKDIGKGMGLGLSISRHLARESLGGDLVVADTPGGGATFVMRLPTRAASLVPNAGPQRLAS